MKELVDREKDPDEYYETISIHTDASSTTPKTVKKSDSITRIYACATMWHETREEMMEMLKSILRMDEDQCARRVAQKYLRVVDPDYYEFESKDYSIALFKYRSFCYLLTNRSIFSTYIFGRWFRNKRHK